MNNNKLARILDWRIAQPKEIINQFNSMKSNTKTQNQGLFAKTISPTDLYCYLKIRFGDPNGFCMKLKESYTTDNLIHWHYELIDNNNYIHIYGKKTYIEIIYSSKHEFSDEDWMELIKDIKTDIKRFGEKKSNLMKNFEKWHVFTNPYKLIIKNIEKTEKEIISLNKELLSIKQEFFNITHISEKISRLSELNFILNMLIPIMAETFINAIIFILCKPEIKKDQTKFNAIKRDTIYARISSLHLTCQFLTKIDLESNTVKKFRTIMNERNDLLHGNFMPLQTSYDFVYFDKDIPTFNTPQSPIESLFRKFMQNIGANEVLTKLYDIREFKSLIINSIHPQWKDKILQVLNTIELGWDDKRNIVGVLFSEDSHITCTSPEDKQPFHDWNEDLRRIHN